MKIYQAISNLITAIENCRKSGNSEWESKHTEELQRIERLLPSGSGIDCGAKIDLETSRGNKIVITTSFHHMNDVGYYDGWTEHTVIVTPDFVSGVDLRITGKDRNDIKDYLYDVFAESLNQEYTRE